LKNGRKIACIVATMGTTDAFGLDDLQAIHEIRDNLVDEFQLDYRPQIHADAVIGWAWSVFNDYDFEENPLGFQHRTVRALAGTTRRIQHLGLADSIGIDFHKTGFTPYISSLFLTRDVADASFCLSKGLSCPVGSVLCGSQEFIDDARRWRKMVGGGMRQAGILAAAGLVALDTMVDRLAEDHQNARRLAQGLANIDGLTVDADSIQTNIVIFDIDEKVANVPDFMKALVEAEVLVSYPGEHSVRMVTHRHISGGDVEEALSRTSKVVRELRG
ncbi:MAG: hypothetical protein IIB89_10035, partial [Chloroflexi bacterium]|nr:hypothetical protein [Chloroflexota bacterium]